MFFVLKISFKIYATYANKEHILLLTLKGGVMDNNLDINKMLEMLSKMDKDEIESKIKQAQGILNSKNINPNDLKK